MRFAWPWEGGLLSMQPAINRLKEVLPPTFEELPTEFACGVVCRDGSHRVINTGALPEAVAASAAIPILFAPVRIPGQDTGPFRDGGKVDRIGLKQWREFRRGRKDGSLPPALVHLIGRSSPFSGNDNVCLIEKDVTVVKSPKSGMSLLSLGDFNAQRVVARERAAMYMKTKRRRWLVFF
uniref:PNPLA domain-containing protein n=1 Tax=Tetraselmis chuii TaxID=63592 RepID=A0A7S1SMC6_9CHLO